jgi:hypothetical protein
MEKKLIDALVKVHCIGQKLLAHQRDFGEVAERLNAPDLKSGIGFYPIGGSNPPLSASKLHP